MSGNPLMALRSLGQSVWLDYIDRDILEDGRLARLIRDDGLCGLTSNPAIFEKAIASGGAYRTAIARLVSENAGRESIYEQLVLDDISRAADLFRQVYEASDGVDGYVSIEVSPLLAHDTAATVAEARALWARIDRPNIMIKVPGTREGLPAARELLESGININVTLLFSVGRYVEVLDTYMDALETRLRRGQAIDRIASVASFFLSRIDVKVDALLDAIAAEADGDRAGLARALRGQAAIASAAFAYRRFREHCGQERWKALAAAGARPQRPLWASTSTKDPSYSDIKYVEALIAPDTINTLPLATLDAYRDHGRPQIRIEEAIETAADTLHGLTAVGINMHTVDDALEEEGIRKFVEPYQSLLATLDRLHHAG